MVILRPQPFLYPKHTCKLGGKILEVDKGVVENKELTFFYSQSFQFILESESLIIPLLAKSNLKLYS